jgi:hypothetical protein
LFSNTLSLCSSLNVRDQVPDPYRTTSKIRQHNFISHTRIIKLRRYQSGLCLVYIIPSSVIQFTMSPCKDSFDMYGELQQIL